MPIKDGKQYVERLDTSKASVWIQGNKITVPVSSHPAFAGLISAQAELYDMQGQSSFKKDMTYESPTTGDPVGMSFLVPRSKSDLKKRRKMFRRWADIHHGFLGRSPDYMNTTMMAFGAASELLTENDPLYAANMKAYYEYCRENDITLSHAFVMPRIERLRPLMKTLEQPDAPSVVEKTKEGLIVNGAFMLATQGVTAEEILVYPSTQPSPHNENPYAFSFAIPNNLPGVKFICRESFVAGTSRYDYPLSSRFEEMDTLVVLDHVLVPHERVFMYGDTQIMARFFEESHFYTHVGHQVLCRAIAKTEFMLGTIELIIETLGLRTYTQIIEKAAEVIAMLESLKGLLVACETNARLDKWGSMLPDSKPLYAANYLFPKLFPQMVEIIQLLGASGIVMIPNEQDFVSEAAGDINRYLRGINLDAKQNVGLCRLAWELSASSFAGRQSLYERFFFGNAIKVANRLYYGYTDKDAHAAKVGNFLSDSITKN